MINTKLGKFLRMLPLTLFVGLALKLSLFGATLYDGVILLILGHYSLNIIKEHNDEYIEKFESVVDNELHTLKEKSELQQIEIKELRAHMSAIKVSSGLKTNVKFGGQ